MTTANRAHNKAKRTIKKQNPTGYEKAHKIMKSVSVGERLTNSEQIFIDKFNSELYSLGYEISKTMYFGK